MFTSLLFVQRDRAGRGGGGKNECKQCCCRELGAAPTTKHTAMGTVLHGTKDAEISEPELCN